LVFSNSATFTASAENTCNPDITVTKTGTDADKFNISESGGNYTVTFNETTSGLYNATLTFSSDGAANKTVNLSGFVSSCSQQTIAIYDFVDGNLPTSISPIGTKVTGSGYTCPMYAITSSNYYGNSKAFQTVTGNVLQTVGNTNSYKAFTLKMTGVESSSSYKISLKIGNNAPNYNTTTYTVTLGTASLGTVANNTYVSKECIVSGASLLSGIDLNISTSSNDNVNSAYFDDITITKLCPPDVSVAIENECIAATMKFTVTASPNSGTSIVSYQWYKNGTAIAGATSTTYTPGELYSTGTQITVKVTDNLGMVTQSTPYTYACGPTISDITQPATICAGGALTISNPTTVTAPAGTTIVSQGWEYCSTVDGTYTPIADFASFKASVAGSYKNYYLRYYATNEKAKSVSNAVQIKMFDAPTLNPTTPVQPTAVCNGNALSDLANPSVNLYGASLSTTRWEISTDNVTYSSFNPSTTLSTVSNNGNYLHYVAVNNCGASVTSNPIQIEVLSPTLTMDALANKKAAAGYVKSIAFPQVVTNKCVGTLVYTYTVDKNTSDFTINSTTGELKTKTTLPIGIYTITISASDGVVSDSKTFSLEVIADTPVTLSCSGDSRSLSPCETMTDVTFTVSSHDLVQDITLSLQGSASAFFTVTPSTVTKNTTDVQVTLHQTQALPLGSTTLQVVPISDGAEYSSCNWTFNVSSPITGAITKPTIQTASQTCPLSGSATLSANVSGVSISEYGPCSGYPLYKWMLNGQEVSSASTYGDYSIPSISGATSGDYTLRIYVGPNAYIESPAYTLDYPLQLSIVGEKPEYYCAESVSLQATIGASVKTSRYEWYNGEERIARTSETTYEMPLNCTGLDSDVPLLVRVVSDDGCVYTATKTVHIKKYNNVYYYCGGTDAASNVTDYTNWCTVENGTTTSCTHPSVNFDADGCQYIINKDNVELKDGQIWNVSGIGSKITLGDGKWTSLSAPSYTSSLGGTLTTQQNYGQPYGWSVFESSYNPANDEINLYTAVSNMDYRTQAKTFKVSGTMNLSNGVDIDVRCGSELNINTSTGNPDIGECEQMWSYGVYIDETHTNAYHEYMIPGSIVTYSGAGATKVQAETYSNVFINTTGTVVWEDGNTEIFGQLKLDNTPSSTDLGGTTLYYDGAVNQSIAPIAYDNLQLQNATTKTLTGNTTVNGQLTIGSGATFDAGDNSYTLNLTDCDNPSSVVVYSGNFDAGNSTVLYSGICNQTIAPMNYYNLSMTNGNKTLSNENVIGVAGSFIPDGSYTYTVDGSTVEFNGTSDQSISAFTFDKLVVNNKSFPSGGAVTMNGNVTVKKQLLMTDGVLTTGTNTLLVTNSASSAVMNGHYTDNTHQSFINGSLTRYLPIGETGTEYTQQYIFPVGNMTNGYIPLTLSQLTTETSSGQPIVTVTGVSGSKSGLNAGTGVTKLNPDYYWSVDGNTAYTSARVSLATPANATLASLDYNSVLYSNGSSDYQPINGTALNSSVIRSNAYPDGYYTFGKIAITPKVYYYNCSTHGDITNISNWWTGEGGSGVNATAFNEDYATWIIKCDATFTKDLSILGSNVEVVVEEDANVTIASNVVFASLHLKKASEVINNNKLTIMEKFTIDPTGVPVGTDRSSAIAILRNNGEMNIYAEKFYIADSWVYNNADATMNFNNTEITIYDPNTNDGNDYAHGGLAGHFINAGDVKMINSGLTVYGRFAQLKNINGATWQVDNTSSAFKRTVLFQAVELYHANNDYVSLECGSTFQVKNSDVRVEFVGNVTGGDANPVNIGGDLIVEDGNLSFHRYSNQGGGTITVEQECGGVFLYDTDNSGDGILTVYSNNSSTQFNIEGTLYTMGFVQEGGSGATMNIKDGGFAFIGDMGATLSGYSWNYKININSGGILHYCGNRTAAADNIGINHGELYYAENFYLSDDPVNQGDFSNLDPATYQALYESLEACMAAYIGTSAQLLPIELTMLYGVCTDETIELHWQTMSETNSDYFAILRSFDGVTFEEVETMSASGTTTEMHNYSYNDKVDYSGIVYYKLRQYDFDGKYTDSKIIAVQTCGKNAQFLFKENEIEVTFKNPAVRNHVIISTVTGVIVYSKVFDSVEAARVAMPQAHGVYIISVIDNKQITSEKFINK
jgi:hypothetical protein